MSRRADSPRCRRLLQACRARALSLAVAAWAWLILVAVAQAAGLTAKLSRIEVQGFPTIRCFVSVVNEAGDSLLGLTVENFTVTENGQPVGGVRLTSRLPGSERIAVALVLDRSASMRGAPIAAAKSAAVEFIRRLSDRDALDLVSFSTRVDPSPGLSTDRGPVTASLERAGPRGETALYDAVRAGVTELAAYKADRRAVVALTDGYDNRSVTTPAQCAEAAKRDGVAIYCIRLGASASEKPLRVMAEPSGGAVFLAASPSDLTGIYRRIAGRIQNEYVVTYTSSGEPAPGAWRTVEVSVADSGLNGSDRRQYIVPERGGVSEAAWWASVAPLRWAVIGLLAINVGLALVLLRRRARS